MHHPDTASPGGAAARGRLHAFVFLTTLTLACHGVLAGEPLEHELEMALHTRLVAVKADPSSTLAPFTTDGCSGGLSASWQILAGKLPEFRAWHGETPAWEACCVDHDRRYHTGGPRDISPAASLEARKNADLRLRNCVLAVGLERSHDLSAIYGVSTGKIHALYGAIADAIHDAVRLGGAPCTGLSWRWGYGWPECADRKP